MVYRVGYMRNDTDWHAAGDGKGEKRCGLHLDCEHAPSRIFSKLLFGFAVRRVRSPDCATQYGSTKAF